MEGIVGIPLLVTILLTFGSASPDAQFDKLHVSLHVFSGRPDPVWEFSRSSPTYDSLLNVIRTHSSTALTPRLGYKGFSVGPLRGRFEHGVTIGGCTDPHLEIFLLDHVKSLTPMGQDRPLSDSLIQMVQTDIQSCQ